jgi:hypothetical protein
MSHSISARADERRGRSRRWFLAGAGVIVVAAGGGVGVGLSSDRRATRQTTPPAQLVDAVAQERQLIANLDATTGGDLTVRRAIRQARADHAEHLRTLQALEALAAGYGSNPARARSTGPSKVRGTPLTRAQLHDAEGRASSATAARAASLPNARAQLAALLASIAACEAVHADLFA